LLSPLREDGADYTKKNVLRESAKDDDSLVGGQRFLV
jgi:hypothetical protein